MTDFAREDMRERIARVVYAHVSRQQLSNTADAIMDELGLWEAYEALKELHRTCLGTPVAGGDGGTYVVRSPSAGALNRVLDALRRLRGEQPK